MHGGRQDEPRVACHGDAQVLVRERFVEHEIGRGEGRDVLEAVQVAVHHVARLDARLGLDERVLRQVGAADVLARIGLEPREHCGGQGEAHTLVCIGSDAQQQPRIGGEVRKFKAPERIGLCMVIVGFLVYECRILVCYLDASLCDRDGVARSGVANVELARNACGQGAQAYDMAYARHDPLHRGGFVCRAERDDLRHVPGGVLAVDARVADRKAQAAVGEAVYVERAVAFRIDGVALAASVLENDCRAFEPVAVARV